MKGAATQQALDEAFMFVWLLFVLCPNALRGFFKNGCFKIHIGFDILQ